MTGQEVARADHRPLAEGAVPHLYLNQITRSGTGARIIGYRGGGNDDNDDGTMEYDGHPNMTVRGGDRKGLWRGDWMKGVTKHHLTILAKCCGLNGVSPFPYWRKFEEDESSTPE